MARGSEPTIVWLAKVIPFVFQVAVGQNFGWLNEKAKMKKKINWDENCKWLNSMIYLFLKMQIMSSVHRISEEEVSPPSKFSFILLFSLQFCSSVQLSTLSLSKNSTSFSVDKFFSLVCKIELNIFSERKPSFVNILKWNNFIIWWRKIILFLN